MTRIATVLSLLSLLLMAACGSPPAPPAADADSFQGTRTELGDLSITDAVAWGISSSASATAGWHMTSTAGDTLVEVTSPHGTAGLHDVIGGVMSPMTDLPLDAGRGVTLGAGGPHVMITEMTEGYARGDSLTVTLRFARAGTVTMRLPVVRFSDAQSLLSR